MGAAVNSRDVAAVGAAVAIALGTLTACSTATPGAPGLPNGSAAGQAGPANTLTPVSYTHLDVYKRQILRRAGYPTHPRDVESALDGPTNDAHAGRSSALEPQASAPRVGEAP